MGVKNQNTAYILCLLALLALCTAAHAQWTEPERIPGTFGLGGPRVVAVDDTLHVVAASGTDIYYMRSIDNGQSWIEPVCPPSDFYRSYMPDISFSNNLVHIVFIGRFQTQQPLHSYHMSSSDGGRTWSTPQQIHDEGTRYPRLAGYDDTLFVSSHADVELFVLLSLDNGETWSEPLQAEYTWGTIPPPIIMYSDGRIHLVYQLGVQDDTTGLEIYYRYSDDLGVTWSDRYGLSTLEHWQEGKDSQAPSAYADSVGNIVALWMDYKYGSACGITGDILGRVSRNNGETWLPETRLSYNQTGLFSDCLIFNNELYAAWSDYFMFYCQDSKIMFAESLDWGENWSVPDVISGLSERSEVLVSLLQNSTLEYTIFHCLMDVIFPSENSGIYYFQNQEFTNITNQDNMLLPQDITFNAYPNPFNSSTVISYKNIEGGEIEIYDITGRLVKQLNDGGSKEGKVTWDATDASGKTLSSGVYFVKAVTPQEGKAIKLIYMK